MSLTSDTTSERLTALREINGVAHGAIFESQNVGYDENITQIEAVLDDVLARPDVLLALLYDAHDEIRAEACELFDAFAQIGWGTEYIAGEERNAALRALVVRAIPALHAAIADVDARTIGDTSADAGTMAATGDASADAGTMAAIGDASADAGTMAAIADASADAGAVAAIRDRSASVRAAAIVAILAIPRAGDAWRDPDGDEDSAPLPADPDELELVRNALLDADADVRAQAIRVLARRLGRAAEDDLSVLVDDRERVVEDQLIEALGRYQSELVLPAIIRRVAENPGGHTLSYTSDGCETGTMLLDWLCAYPLDAQRARDILLPIAANRAVEEYRVGDAVRGLIEHVDLSCRDTLAALVPAGNMTSEYALIALARLRADAPVDAIAHWLDPTAQSDRIERLVDAAGIALAATGRTDHLDLLLRRLVGGSQLGVLRIVSMFDDPRIYAAVTPLLRRGASVGLARYASLALGAAGNAAALPQLHEASSIREARLYVQLAIGLIDPTAVAGVPDAWPRHVTTNEVEHLVLAYAVRLLGRRLAGRAVPAAAKPLVDAARRWVASLDISETLACHRGRGGFSGIGFSWVFELRDVIEEARRLLA